MYQFKKSGNKKQANDWRRYTNYKQEEKNERIANKTNISLDYVRGLLLNIFIRFYPGTNY